MLKDLALKSVYRTEEDDLLTDLYIPLLKNSICYDRAVGFFGSGVFYEAAKGISSFIENNGKMRLIIGHTVEENEIYAINQGYENRSIIEKLSNFFIEDIDKFNSDLFNFRIECLSWLIENKRLDIKLALRPKGMYHDKIGIFTDKEDNKVVFHGSANESINAYEWNYESMDVYPNWKKELEGYYTNHINNFENLWNKKNKKNNLAVVDFPDLPINYLIEKAKQNKSKRKLNFTEEINLYDEYYDDEIDIPYDSIPEIPKILNNNVYNIFQHQKEALISWQNNNYQGIFALATGSGKTITSIHGAVKIYEKKNRLVLIICVPFINLADQWVEELSKFNIKSFKCYDNKKNWEEKLKLQITNYNIAAIDFVSIVVVNNTFKKEIFQNIIKTIDPNDIFWIGDECHHHASRNINQLLIQNVKYRIGLSATPDHYLDNDQQNQRLTEYYGNVVATFTLKDAITQKILTPYNYHIIPVELTETEIDEYIRLSIEIGRLSYQSDAENSKFKMLLLERARLLSNAQNKLIKLNELLENIEPTPYSLFYCGDGEVENADTNEYERQITEVSRALDNHGWKISRFTSRESKSKRKIIMNEFKSTTIDSLVAIKCLDEGIDIPACKVAFIIASTSNPRQFIQRRGRILRRYEGKEKAEIYDFFVYAPRKHQDNIDSYEKRLVERELRRIAEFSNLSLNYGESHNSIKHILEMYNLEHLIV
jgi:superfamily II DNA or RNA helicase